MFPLVRPPDASGPTRQAPVRSVLLLLVVILTSASPALARGRPLPPESSKQAQERAKHRKGAKRKRGKGATRVSRKKRKGARKGARKKGTRVTRSRRDGRQIAKDTITFSPEKGKQPLFGSVKTRKRVKRAGAKKTTKMATRRRKAARTVGWKDPIAKTHEPYKPGGSTPYADGTREHRLRAGTSNERILSQGERTTSAAETERRLKKSKAKGKERLRS